MTTANGAPFTVKVWIYPGADLSTSADSWGIAKDISTYVRYPGSDGGQAIEYTAGRGDEASQVDAGTMDLTLDNRDGRFSTDNPNGTYYPDFQRSTPVRMGVVCGTDAFTRSVSSGWGTADSGHTWSVSGTAADWAVDGSKGTLLNPTANTARVATFTGATSLDADIILTAIPISAATGGLLAAGAILRRVDASNMMLARVDFSHTASAVLVNIVKIIAGVQTTLASTTLATTYSAGQRWRLQFQADGNLFRMKAWPEAGTEPDWQIFAEETTLAGSASAVYLARFSGNTNVTTQLGIDDIQVTGLEFTGSLIQLPLRWDKRGNNSWAPVRAAGILRRLNQGKGALKSPLARQLPSYGPYGYWPLEDAAGAQVFGSAVANVGPATFTGVDPGADATLAGGGLAPTLTAVTGEIRGLVKTRVSGTDGFSFLFFTKFGSGLPVAKTAMMTIVTYGKAAKWIISVSTTTLYTDAYGSDGTLLSSSSTTYSGVDTSEWVAWQLETAISGSDTTWAFSFHAVGAATYFAQTGTVTGGSAVSSVGRWVAGGSNLPVGTSFAQVWAGPNTLPFVADSFSLVSSGYVGELASDRIARLGDEEGLQITVESGASGAVGVQPQGSLIAALRTAEAADMGILYERATGLGYRPRIARYNQAVTLAVTVAAGQIDDPPEPISDDQRLKNSITVSREGGSFAIAQDTASISREGEWPDPVTLNVSTDEVLPFHAGWRLHLGVYPQLRWPGLSLDFARNPDLLPTWRSRAYGMRMTVTTGRTQVAGGEPDVIVEGYSATLWPHGWKVKLNCSAAAMWDVGVLDSVTVPPRADTAGSQLQIGVNTTATSWTVDTTVGPAWNPSTTFPFLIKCDGEVVSVTAISGAGPTGQVFTVTRSVNGIVKSHLALAALSLAAPARAAL